MLRELDTNELEMVSGGNEDEVIATGVKQEQFDVDHWAFTNAGGGSSGGIAGAAFGGGSGANFGLAGDGGIDVAPQDFPDGATPTDPVDYCAAGAAVTGYAAEGACVGFVALNYRDLGLAASTLGAFVCIIGGHIAGESVNQTVCN